MADSLSQFMRGGVDPSELNRKAIIHDKWDSDDFAHVLKEMKSVRESEEKLAHKVDTGSSAYADLFFSLIKANPELEKRGRMNPAYLVNHAVAEQVEDLTEHKELRTYTLCDDVASALACMSLEPALEILFDKLDAEQKKAQQIAEMMAQQGMMQQKESDLEDLINQLENGEEETQELIDMQADLAAIQEAIDALAEAIAQETQELMDSLDSKSLEIKEHMRDALKDVNEQMEELEGIRNWSTDDDNSFQKLPAEKRIQLAQKLSTDRFRKISELLGQMVRLAHAERQKKVIYANDEVRDIENGNDLSKIIPMELLSLTHPVLKKDFILRYYQEQLNQFKFRGEESIGKGGIIFCEDGSGSMSGDKELWAKAVGIALLQVARAQRREFHGIHFGGARQIAHFNFSDITKVSVDDVIKFAELFFNGSTCFMTPLSKAVDILEAEFSRTGAIKADIVFCTDGAAAVDPKWLEKFKKDQERLGFNVYGIAIGCDPRSEPLATICDGRVTDVKTLATGENIAGIFRSIW